MASHPEHGGDVGIDLRRGLTTLRCHSGRGWSGSCSHANAAGANYGGEPYVGSGQLCMLANLYRISLVLGGVSRGFWAMG